MKWRFDCLNALHLISGISIISELYRNTVTFENFGWSSGGDSHKILTAAAETVEFGSKTLKIGA